MTRAAPVLLLAALVLGGCVARRTLGDQCALATQCDAPLVCGLARCRLHCATQRDCPAGSLCVAVNGGAVCLLPDERECARDSECPDELVCRTERCGPMCTTDRDCAGATCVAQVCVDMTEEPCALTSDCGGGLVCIGGRCAPPCREDLDCREGSRCVDGTCEVIVVERDAGALDAGSLDAGPPDAGSLDAGPPDAGPLDAAPPDAGPPDAGPSLIRTCTLPEDCRAPNAASYGCVDNTCTILACVDGFGDCDGFYNSGCEIDTSSAAAHCGGCGMACGVAGECTATVCDGIASIGYGERNLCAVRDNGALACTGREASGQLGTGVPTSNTGIQRVPAVAVGVSDAVLVASGRGNVCALHADGRVSCTGSGASGQIGDGSWTGRWAHRYAEGLTDAVDFDTSYDSACAVRATGRVVCWGVGDRGALGNGSVAHVNTPTEVTGITDAVAVAAGQDFACAVRTGGTVECWGENRRGTLGDGSTTVCDPSQSNACSLTPVTVSGISDAVDVVACGYKVCVLRANNEVSCWGDGFASGGGAAPTPVSIPGIADAVQIAADFSAVCVRRTGGTVSCFGSNSAGALGDGTYDDSATPVDVVGLTDATDLALGPQGGCALSSSRGLVCWGGSNNGMFGPTGVFEEWLPARPADPFNP